MSRLNEQAVEADETEPNRMMASPVIEHPPFEDASHLPGEPKERSHVGESQSDPEVTKGNSPSNSREKPHGGERQLGPGETKKATQSKRRVDPTMRSSTRVPMRSREDEKNRLHQRQHHQMEKLKRDLLSRA